MRSRRIQFWQDRLTMMIRPPDAGPLPDRRYIFCLTAGRSGSGLLHKMFQQVSQVEAHHEPFPRLDLHRPRAAKHPGYARKVLAILKAPTLAQREKPVYFESNHLICKGYFHPLMALAEGWNIRPDFIRLHRSPRAIALSHLRLGAIPGRTKQGRAVCVDPGEPVLLDLPDPDRFDDYQLCYWNALEVQARQGLYGEEAEAAGCRVVDITLDDLNREGGFERLLTDLAIDLSADDQAAIAAIRGKKVNAKDEVIPELTAPRYSPERLDALETEIDRAVGS